MFKRTLIDRLHFFVLKNSNSRVNYLKKKNVFALLGDRVFYQARKIPVEPNLIKIHNNVAIAADVDIIPHDIIHFVFNRMDNKKEEDAYQIHLGCVEIMDNCFIGSHAVILGNVRIGPNAIVAAGAVVTRDVPEGVIVGGNPAKVIGSFDELKKRRESEIGVSSVKMERAEDLWKQFYKERDMIGY